MSAFFFDVAANPRRKTCHWDCQEAVSILKEAQASFPRPPARIQTEFSLYKIEVI
jgi:hypothetical protein